MSSNSKSLHRFLIIFAVFLFACHKQESVVDQPVQTQMIKACDLSFLPEIRSANILTKNMNGQPEDMLVTLKNAGVNTIRLRLWNNPSDGHSGFEEVKSMSNEIHQRGMKVWLSVHYSDTWADPGYQQKPGAWINASYNQLKDSVYAYTKKVVLEMNPDYIQIGNEINNGFLWPDGSYNNPDQMFGLLEQGIKAVRDCSGTSKIILHYAGYQNANPFFTKMNELDYDIIGLSYYPLWHGKNLDSLQAQLNIIGTQFNKDILIAETSYPFTLGWNDWTNNIIGDTSQILSEFPANPQGQKNYLQRIKAIITDTPKGLGFCYWGGEWIAFKGNQATNGSSYENQALWDFNNQAVPAIQVFSD
ncbi:MAG: glycosyl hydrolase 53 family protein [Bacteroidota bacterium]